MAEQVTSADVEEAVRRVVAEVRIPHAQTLELTTLQKGIGSLFLAGCLWVGSTVQSTSVEMASMREKVAQSLADRYTSKDAERDQRANATLHDGLERRVTTIEEKLL